MAITTGVAAIGFEADGTQWEVDDVITDRHGDEHTVTAVYSTLGAFFTDVTGQTLTGDLYAFVGYSDDSQTLTFSEGGLSLGNISATNKKLVIEGLWGDVYAGGQVIIDATGNTTGIITGSSFYGYATELANLEIKNATTNGIFSYSAFMTLVGCYCHSQPYGAKIVRGGISLSRLVGTTRACNCTGAPFYISRSLLVGTGSAAAFLNTVNYSTVINNSVLANTGTGVAWE